MRASVLRLHSPDVPDLRTWVPPDERHFGFLLQIIAGPQGDDAGESFDVRVCTPSWIANRLEAVGPQFGSGLLLVARYDFAELERIVRRRFETVEASDWSALGRKLSGLAHWEFEDHADDPV
jgi:hypothetical protein